MAVHSEYETLTEALKDLERNISYLNEFGLENGVTAERSQALRRELAHAIEQLVDDAQAARLAARVYAMYAEVTEVCDAEGRRVFDAACAEAHEAISSGRLAVHEEDQLKAMMGEADRLDGVQWLVYADRIRARAGSEEPDEQ